jgi:ribosomal protein S18 acetylase RimI-like enzyme
LKEVLLRTGDLTIRSLHVDEWRALRALRLRALADAPDAFGATLAEAEAEPDEAWRARIERDRSILVVAEKAGSFVGMAGGGDAPTPEHIAGLYGMWVDPAVRGTGVADALVQAVVEWARAAGYPQIGLGVTTTNGRAIAFYRRLGFVEIGQRMPLREGSEVEIEIMGRPLG